jgi:hypothetical protein
MNKKIDLNEDLSNLPDLQDNPIFKKHYKNSFPNFYKIEILKYIKKYDLEELSDFLKISKKNIERWLSQGIKRRKGGGRKIRFPLLEEEIKKWIDKKLRNSQPFPSRKEIISKMKELNQFEEFRASKGCCDKFLKRNYTK